MSTLYRFTLEGRTFLAVPVSVLRAARAVFHITRMSRIEGETAYLHPDDHALFLQRAQKHGLELDIVDDPCPPLRLPEAAYHQPAPQLTPLPRSA